METLVSVISPCYNGARYLPLFLDSMISQTYNNIELLFVDDGSTDNTKDVLFSYRDELERKGIRLRYIYKKNGGQASAINAALPLFSGEYLMWCDSDDILLPNNIEHKLITLEKNPNCGFVLSQGIAVSSSDLNTPLWKLNRQINGNNDDLFSDLVYEQNVVYVPATILVRREVMFEAIPASHSYEGKQGQNWQLMLPLAYVSKACYLDEVLFKYVIHDDSHSHKKLSYQEQIKRDNEFEVLITTTISNIPNISTEEVDNWGKKVKIKYLRKKLRHSFDYYKLISSYDYKRQLKKTDKLLIEDSFCIYTVKKHLRKLKYNIKEKRCKSHNVKNT